MTSRLAAAAAIVGAVVSLPAAAAVVPASKPLRVPGGIGIAVFVEPASHLFGDPVTASVEILVDPRRVDPAGIRLKTGFEPYRLAARPEITRRETKGLVSIRHRYRLLCLRAACRPRPGRAKQFRFASATATFVRPNGVLREISRRFFPVTAASRLVPDSARSSDLQARAQPFPPIDYRVDPVRLSRLLFAGAGLLALLGLVLVAQAVAPLLGGGLVARRLARLGPVQRELALLRAGLARGERELQRKALDGLAGTLGGDGTEDLAISARRLAWSEPGPDPGAAGALATEVGRRLRGKDR